MIRTCIIDIEKEVVITCVDYEEVPVGTPPGFEEGYMAVASETAQVGWPYINGEFIPVIDPNIKKNDRILRARNALVETDTVALRCFKENKPFPADWLVYVNELRAIVRLEDTDVDSFPERPKYPLPTD